jgi:hypothetical protein
MKTSSMQWFIIIMACAGLILVQPGVSSTWLLDAHRHTEIDADLYGQTPDGHTLPGRAAHPPHSHPADDSAPGPDVTPLQHFAVAYTAAILSEANRPSLEDCRSDAEVIAAAIFLDPPEHPPRA